jgi:hypothetical protein
MITLFLQLLFILDEFKGFNPSNMLKHSFWCSPVFCCMMWRQLLGLKGTGFIENI